jgi:hypothetical protein
MIKYKINLIPLAFLMSVCCVFFSQNASATNKQIDYVGRKGIHVAFPDVIDACNHEVLSFREGNTHAADKGYIRVLLDPVGISKVYTFEDDLFDLRNPYFHKNSNGLFLYVTVFDYKRHEFIGTKEFKIFSSDCDVVLELVSETDYIIYEPDSSSLASFSRSSDSIFASIDEKVFVTSTNLDHWTRVFDEEISFFSYGPSKDVLGIGRNQRKAGLPLLLYQQNENDDLNYRSWCGAFYDSALVSPKVHVFDSGYHVSYSSRRLIGTETVDSSNNQLGIHMLSFASLDALINCNPSSSSGLFYEADIDGGYQTYNAVTDRLFFYARLKGSKYFQLYFIDSFLEGKG